ncbi:putative calcineurin-like phosphoesterase [Lyophyllum shimeji]|uniref:Calcineurin-like phosphoesterase n=1 Tax=Lyophyllum shimeji TaxID=47721 RepID=A0A9P3Q0N0_LYOSH|nr:putative calcineurin-like phosphoesterase [Lyophyllum shimeji]
MAALPYTPRSITTASSIVHLEYKPAALSPVAPGWTRFVCISDTHTRSFAVPDGDVLLHSGDLTNLGTLSDFQKTMEWLYSLPHKVKIIIAGNHDLTLHIDYYEREHRRWHRDRQDVEQILELLTGPRARAAGVVYLQDSSHTFQTKPNGRTWSVYGSPWSPEFFNWAFNYPREEGEALVAKFPKTDILLTHGPPSGIFDRTRCGDLVGCEALRARLPSLRPRLHVFGHIHEARGAYVHAWAEDGASASEPPGAQNEDGDDLSDEEDDLDISFDEEEGAGGGGGEDGDDGDGDDGGENGTEATRSTPGSGEEEEREETVFVNAATFPAGRAAWRGTHRVPFGGPGFQAVVVDLRD